MIEIASYSSSNEKIMSYFLFTICCEAADLEKNGYESNESHSLGTTVNKEYLDARAVLGDIMSLS